MEFSRIYYTSNGLYTLMFTFNVLVYNPQTKFEVSTPRFQLTRSGKIMEGKSIAGGSLQWKQDGYT